MIVVLRRDIFLHNAVFQIINFDTNKCLDTMGLHSPVQIEHCHNLGGNQMFLYTSNFEIKHDKYCLDGTAKDAPVTLSLCNGKQANQKWSYNVQVNRYNILWGKLKKQNINKIFLIF